MLIVDDRGDKHDHKKYLCPCGTILLQCECPNGPGKEMIQLDRCGHMYTPENFLPELEIELKFLVVPEERTLLDPEHLSKSLRWLRYYLHRANNVDDIHYQTAIYIMDRMARHKDVLKTRAKKDRDNARNRALRVSRAAQKKSSDIVRV